MYGGMSALGQKQTFALQKVMSALPPKATFAAHWRMSALGQKRTSQVSARTGVLHTFRVISQTRPSARQSKCVFPDRWAIICSIIRPPNPVCVGSRTFGPLDSVQRRCNCPSASCHFTSTWPSGTAKAPYLAALVANSCKVIAMA
jgi:hypothetical protein